MDLPGSWVYFCSVAPLHGTQQMLCNNLWTDQRWEVNSISGGDWKNEVLSPSWSQTVRGWLGMRTWVPPSRAGGHTGQKEKEVRCQVCTEMSPEPCLETSKPGPWRGRPCCGSTAIGTPMGSSSSPRDHILFVLYSPVVSSSVHGGGGGGWELRGADIPSILSATSVPQPVVEGREGTAGGHGTPTFPEFMGLSGLWQLEWLGTLMGRESAQAFGGKSLTSRTESGPEDPWPSTWVPPGPPGPTSHLSLGTWWEHGGVTGIIEWCWWNLEGLLSWAGEWRVGRSWDSASDFLPGTFYKPNILAEILLGSFKVPMWIHCMQSWSVRVSTQTIREYAAVGLQYSEMEMAMSSSIPAWRTPWTEKPGMLQSTGSERVRHVWGTNTILKALNLKHTTLSHTLEIKSYRTDRTFCLVGGLKGYYDQTFMDNFENKGFQH